MRFARSAIRSLLRVSPWVLGVLRVNACLLLTPHAAPISARPSATETNSPPPASLAGAEPLGEQPPHRRDECRTAGEEDAVDRRMRQAGRRQRLVGRGAEPVEVGRDPGLEIGAGDRLLDRQILVPEAQRRCCRPATAPPWRRRPPDRARSRSPSSISAIRCRRRSGWSAVRATSAIARSVRGARISDSRCQRAKPE